MAKGKKTGGKNFEKGQSGNPAGRPKLPEYLKKAKQLNKVKLDELLQKYIHATTTQLKNVLQDAKKPDSEISAMDVMVVRVIIRVIDTGDYKTLDFLFNRLVGKVKEEISVEGSPYAGLMEIIKQRNGE